jgi:hypothetical protein
LCPNFLLTPGFAGSDENDGNPLAIKGTATKDFIKLRRDSEFFIGLNFHQNKNKK